MIRLLIADDEKIIRETICNIIDWKSLGIEVVAVCKDGLEAYDAILDEYPDIVLTDIRMPKLSGLELIHRITQNHDDIQFIILSGYDEFDYAREAMRYGIKHYILKPCNEQEIINAVQDAVKEHYRNLEMRGDLPDSAGEGGLLRTDLIYHIFLRALPSGQSLENLPAIFGRALDFYHIPYQLCYLYFLEEEYVQKCIDHIRELTAANGLGCSFTYVYVKNTLAFFTPDNGIDLDLMDRLLKTVDFGAHPGMCVYDRTECSSLLSLLETLCGRVKRYETISLYSQDQSTTIYNYASLFRQITDLADSLSHAENEETRVQYISEIRNIISGIKNKDLLQALTGSILMKAMQNNSNYSAADITEFMASVSSKSTTEEICSFLFEKLDSLFGKPAGEEGKYKPFIQEIMDYTKKHIADPNLTLKWIVETQLFMNVDYVSRQFMLQTGTKFSAYLNGLRIERAKQLLLQCDTEKIYSVAEQVGCGNNPQYFSHLFKKFTGMTPKEYIQKMTETKK